MSSHVYVDRWGRALTGLFVVSILVKTELSKRDCRYCSLLVCIEQQK